MKKQPLKSSQILLLEDDWTLKHTLCKALKKKGYGCLSPTSAEETFSLLNKAQVQMVIADLNMTWLNTFDLCTMIKRSKQFAHIPFVFISGSSDEQNIKKAFLCRCDDYLTKPFHISELLNIIETLFTINQHRFTLN
jgi:DNA-binding response OmpR family regulator